MRAFDLSGKYIVLEDKDLKNAVIEKSDVILIKDFVQEEEVEGKRYGKPNYPEPDRVEKMGNLFKDVLNAKGFFFG